MVDDRQFVSDACAGEKCWCGQRAVRKVEEVIFFDDPLPHRRPFAAYICREHFDQMMHPAVRLQALRLVARGEP